MIALQVWSTFSTLLFSSLAGVLVSLLLLFFLLLALFVLVTATRDQASDVFVLILVAVACIVTLVPEWLYINDSFGGNLSRMNTVFKFFYQGWILLALASAYSVYYVAAVRPAGARVTFSAPRVAFLVVATLLVIAGLFYPTMAFYSKANAFGGTPTLDGVDYMKSSAPEDYRAIQWANANIKGAPVLAEAIGGEYSDYARLSTHTGIPAVLGWPGHEIQWRGTVQGWESCEADINRMYATPDVNEAKSIIKKYGIAYVLVGRLERQTPGADGKPKFDQKALDKFSTFMDTVYSDGSTAIYRVRQ